jgi:glycosyltransferase involved in cell wall biosynthesis
LVTYRRAEFLRATLERLSFQSRRLDALIVVDNEASDTTRFLVESAPRSGSTVTYLRAPENLGFAGGVAFGMEHAMRFVHDGDWLVLFDDDDPPPRGSTVEEVEAFAMRMLRRDRRTAAVGLTGGRFDWQRGRIVRVPSAELTGAVSVDYVGGDHIPFFRAGAIRDVGPFDRLLFFGLSEVEFGLRLRRAGYHLYAHGDRWAEARRRFERSGGPGLRLPPIHWKRYYTLRNTIYILRLHGHPLVAVEVAAMRGIAKPLVNLPLTPILAARHLGLNARACFDGFVGNMGRRVEPDGTSKRDGRSFIPAGTS